MEGYHKSVLLKEVLDNLSVQSGLRYLDCTLGDGGYSLEILKLGGKIVGIDQDPEAIGRTRERFIKEGISEDQFQLVLGNFSNLAELVPGEFAGIVFDLGVSSLQLEEGQRGFSFSKEAELDMRMSPDLAVKAADLVNGLHKGELTELLEKYGEVNDRRIVQAILRARENNQIRSTTELARIIEHAVGHKRGQIHPATQVFQALRIAVNDELNALQAGLRQADRKVSKNGVICVVAFHSLEDRIVKNIFNSWQTDGLGKVITQKPIVPGEQELLENPRSRSAKLRVIRIISRKNQGPNKLLNI